MKILAIRMVLPLLLSAGTALAESPVFTFSFGIQFDTNWYCSASKPWFRFDATSDGLRSKSGNVPFDVDVVFEPNCITWSLSPSVFELRAGLGCEECCSGGGDPDRDRFTPLPSVSCGFPMYPPYTGFNPDGRWDQWVGAPIMVVLADGLPSPEVTHPSFILPMCQTGAVRYTFCRSDFDANGCIDGGDLSVLLAEFGAYLFFAERVDLDDSGEVDAGDLAVLLLDWGPCSVPPQSIQADDSKPFMLQDQPAPGTPQAR